MRDDPFGASPGDRRARENGQFFPGNGQTYNIPIEVTERRYPVRVLRYAFHNADGGAGGFAAAKA